MRCVAALLCGLVLWAPSSAEPAGAQFMPQLVAQSFVQAMLEGEIEAALPLCARRTNLDGRWLEGAPLGVALRRASGRVRALGLKLRRVQILSRAQMMKRFGKPPARIKGAIRAGCRIALARLSRAGLVLVLCKEKRFWRVTALTD